MRDEYLTYVGWGKHSPKSEDLCLFRRATTWERIRGRIFGKPLVVWIPKEFQKTRPISWIPKKDVEKYLRSIRNETKL